MDCFQQPFSCCLYGPSGCGKTSFVTALLESNLIQPPPRKVLYILDEGTQRPKDMPPNVRFSTNLNDVDSLKHTDVAIIDDLMTEAGNSEKIVNLFTKGVHHRNVSCFYLCQKLFTGGQCKYATTIADNCHYKIVFKCPQNKQSIRFLAQKMMPSGWKDLVSTFEKVTERPYSYMLIDLRMECPEELRYRSNVLCEDGGPPLVYKRV